MSIGRQFAANCDSMAQWVYLEALEHAVGNAIPMQLVKSFS